MTTVHDLFILLKLLRKTTIINCTLPSVRLRGVITMTTVWTIWTSWAVRKGRLMACTVTR